MVQKVLPGKIQSFIFLFFVLIPAQFLFPGQSFAQPLSSSQEVAILDFRVTGDVPARFYSEHQLPGFLREAAVYLFPYVRRYPVQDPEITEKAIQPLRFNPAHPLNEMRIRGLCANSGASFLISGSAHFSREATVILEIQSISCRSHSQFATGKETGHLNKLQILLRNALYKATPFASPSHQRFPAGSKSDTGKDTVLIIDRSGSMNPSLTVIKEALLDSAASMSPDSRMGAVLFSAEEPQIFSIGSPLSTIANSLTGSRGKTSVSDLNQALDEVLKYRTGGRSLNLLLFTDIDHGNKKMYSVEDRLKRMMKRGHTIKIFPMPTRTPDSIREWSRIERTLKLDSPTVLYGRRVGFLQGYSLYFIQNNHSFYRSDFDGSSWVQRNQLPEDRIRPIHTVRYPRDQINLFDLPGAFAEKNRLKITGLSSIDSGLAMAIQKEMDDTGSMSAPYSALIKNAGRSFWIRLNRKEDYETLLKHEGKTVYLGIAFRQSNIGSDTIRNEPDVLQVLSASEVPRLFINTMERLSSNQSRSVHPGVIWFLLSEIREVKNGR